MVQARTSPTGLIPWFLQRVTGVLLALWVATHFIFWHFLQGPTGEINFASVSARALTRGFAGYVWELILAALCIYHGLNGVRNVVFDYIADRKKVGWLTPVLWVIGVVGFGFICTHLARFHPAM